MKRWLAALAVAFLVGAGIVAGYVLYKRDQAADVRGSSTEEFVTTAEPEPKPPPAPPRAEGIVWPTFKYDATRAGVSPYSHRPPYRAVWGFAARTLVEFPPALAFGRLYFANNDGILFAVRAQDGKLVWRYRSGRVQAASPTVVGRTVFHTFLYRQRGKQRSEDGELVAFDADTGAVRWRKRLAPSESSPLVHRGRVYVGDWSGKVYAFDVRTGRQLWAFQTDGEVKGGLAASGARVFVGSYDHHLYALNARTGRQLWRAGTQLRLGNRGRFYSTPAIAYGRVYIGATDGKVYSFGAASGRLLWSHGTGSYVYSSPAVWNRLVFAGSYDGSFYAFDAATGDVRWRFKGGKVSGSPTVMGGLVYFATLKGESFALNARTGKRVWKFDDGRYASVVADGERVYQVGTGRVYGLEPSSR
jgi:outer membrane protein assembly factor BamB